MTYQSAYKPKKTLKSPTIQARVMQKRASGDSKAKIARDLGMAVNTVTSVLALNDFERTIQSEQKESLRLIPAARKAVMNRLEKNDGAIGIKVLENTIWPLNEKSAKDSGDPTLVLAIQNLMGNVRIETPAQTQAISDAQERAKTIDCQSSASQSDSTGSTSASEKQELTVSEERPLHSSVQTHKPE